MSVNKTRQLQGSIRNRILIFSILVTLVPSIGMVWFWYDISRKTTTAKVEQKFMASADIIEREIGLWLKERKYDLRVFSNSFVVAENLAIYQNSRENGDEISRESKTALNKISTYLGILIRNFKAYQSLSVLDTDGMVLASSDPVEKSTFIPISTSWQQQAERNQFFVGDNFFTHDKGSPLALVGIPLLRNDDNATIGYFILHVHLGSIQSLLYSSLPDNESNAGHCRMTLLESSGRILFDTHHGVISKQPDAIPDTLQKLFNQPKILHEYTSEDQTPVLSMAFTFKNLPWALLITEEKKHIFSDIMEARNQILLIAALLTIAIGGYSILISRQIIIPLQALTRGVLQVAGGDLRVNLPIRRKDELGLVTEMFNEMVSQLDYTQSKLRELATTDSLTGLANRKQIMASLDMQMESYCRHNTSFAVLMLDIDFFKMINDTYSHPAGDKVLVELASILQQMLRTLDTAGRYGGEEFIIVLSNTDLHQAVQTAERIRLAVERHRVSWEIQQIRVTVSIGVAAITENDSSLANLICRVDKALYDAKKSGRNKVVASSPLALPYMENSEVATIMQPHNTQERL